MIYFTLLLFTVKCLQFLTGESLTWSPGAERIIPNECYLDVDTEPEVLALFKGTLKAKATISSGHPSPRSHTHTGMQQPKDMQDSWGRGSWLPSTQAQIVNTPPS